MQPEDLYRSRKADWNTLDQLAGRGQKRLRGLDPQEVQALSRLYRAVTSDLAIARRDFPDHPVTAYLNRLTAKTHAVIYSSQPMVARHLTQFFAGDFPRLYRQVWHFMLASALLLIIPALLAGFGVALQPKTASWLLPASAQDLIPIVEGGNLWIDIPTNQRPYASSFITQNNIQVTFLAFASGITGGLLTVVVLCTNGLMLGGLLGLTARYNLGWDLATFVIGHGVVELSVIVIAGGTGLMIGWALIRPGQTPRGIAVRQAALQAVKLLCGAAPFLVIAGLIEGFISPSPTIPAWVKWAVGLSTGLVFHGYLLLAGRASSRRLKSAAELPKTR